MNLSKYPIRRIPITLAINFHEDIIKVRQVLLDVAAKYPLVMDDPKATVTVTAFRSHRLNFSLRYGGQENALKVRDEMQERVRNGFLENQIEIPVPKIHLIDRPLPLMMMRSINMPIRKNLKEQKELINPLLIFLKAQVAAVQDRQSPA